MSVFRFQTVRGPLCVDDKARTVSLGDQTVPLDGAVATIDAAGSGKSLETHIRVDGPTFSMTSAVAPQRASDARVFAAGLNTIARGGDDRAMRVFLSKVERRALMTPEEIARERRGNKIMAIVAVGVVFVVAIGVTWVYFAGKAKPDGCKDIPVSEASNLMNGWASSYPVAAAELSADGGRYIAAHVKGSGVDDTIVWYVANYGRGPYTSVGYVTQLYSDFPLSDSVGVPLSSNAARDAAKCVD